MVRKLGPCGNSPVEPIEQGVLIDKCYRRMVVGGRYMDNQRMCIRGKNVSTRGKPVPGRDLEEILVKFTLSAPKKSNAIMKTVLDRCGIALIGFYGW